MPAGLRPLGRPRGTAGEGVLHRRAGRLRLERLRFGEGPGDGPGRSLGSRLVVDRVLTLGTRMRPGGLGGRAAARHVGVLRLLVLPGAVRVPEDEAAPERVRVPLLGLVRAVAVLALLVLPVPVLLLPVPLLVLAVLLLPVPVLAVFVILLAVLLAVPVLLVHARVGVRGPVQVRRPVRAGCRGVRGLDVVRGGVRRLAL
ncbi:hypothetical protein ACWERJ_18765, partial [Streptomyces sp. NPDC004050]